MEYEMKDVLGIPYSKRELFQSVNNLLNACVGNNGGPYDFRSYSKGYFLAAYKLTETLLKDNYKIDILIYPLMYLIRHAIELGIKHFCITLPKCFDEKIEIKYTHRLEGNWESIKKYLLKDDQFNEYNEASGLIEKMECILHDIIEIDPEGEVFRFPTNRKGILHLSEFQHINIGIVHRMITVSMKIFEYWSFLIYEITDYRYELRSHLL